MNKNQPITAIKFLDDFTAKITFANQRSKVIDWRKNIQLRYYKNFFSVPENWRSAKIDDLGFVTWFDPDELDGPEDPNDVGAGTMIPLFDFQVFHLNRRRFDRPIRHRRRSERRRRR